MAIDIQLFSIIREYIIYYWIAETKIKYRFYLRVIAYKNVIVYIYSIYLFCS